MGWTSSGGWPAVSKPRRLTLDMGGRLGDLKGLDGGWHAWGACLIGPATIGFDHECQQGAAGFGRVHVRRVASMTAKEEA